MAKTIFTEHENGIVSVGAEYSQKEESIIKSNKTKEKIYKYLGLYFLLEFISCAIFAFSFFGLIYCITKTISMAWNV